MSKKYRSDAMAGMHEMMEALQKGVESRSKRCAGLMAPITRVQQYSRVEPLAPETLMRQQHRLRGARSPLQAPAPLSRRLLTWTDRRTLVTSRSVPSGPNFIDAAADPRTPRSVCRS